MRIYPLNSPDENGPAYLRRDAAPTSVEAARLVFPRTGTQRMKVLKALAEAPLGLTDDQIQRVTGLGHNTHRARRVDLVDEGWARNTGRVRDGRIVWGLTKEGRAEWRAKR